MNLRKLGILEIFFGPPWTHEERLSWAKFLGQEGLGFYLYGPKADPRLRKHWRDPWPSEYLAELRELSSAFHKEGVKFSVAFSPFGLEFPLSAETKAIIQTKCEQLREIGLDFLGLFFDDMPCTPNLAEIQLEVLDVFQKSLKLPVLFCPSYYSPDPILDKVFGARPVGYLETLGEKIPAGVDIAWTGPKVISSEIPADHLRETSDLLKRKPFLCDNFFANDGPKNCKFLKLKPASGRSPEAFAESSGWSLNLMNESAVSQLMCYSALLVFSGKANPEEALGRAMSERLSPGCAEALMRDRELFLTTGLDGIPEPQRKNLIANYDSFPDPAAKEVSRWLRNEFVVGSECLTD